MCPHTAIYVSSYCYMCVRMLVPVSADAYHHTVYMCLQSDVCWRMLRYADVCWRMLTYAEVCRRLPHSIYVSSYIYVYKETYIFYICVCIYTCSRTPEAYASVSIRQHTSAYASIRIYTCSRTPKAVCGGAADVCWRMLTYADVCWRMLHTRSGLWWSRYAYCTHQRNHRTTSTPSTSDRRWEDCIVSHICRSCFHIRQEVSMWRQVCQVARSKE